MSDAPPPGWWQASDGRWYPPTSAPGTAPQQYAAPQYSAPQYGPRPYAAPQWGVSPGYGPPPMPAPVPPRNGLAIAALAVGIPSFLLAFLPILGYLAAPFALVGIGLGIAGIVRSGRIGLGKGMAVGGLVASVLAVLVLVGWTVLIVVANDEFGPASSSEYAISGETCAVGQTGHVTYAATLTNHTENQRRFTVVVTISSDVGLEDITIDTPSIAPGDSTSFQQAGNDVGATAATCRVVDVTFNGS